MHVFSFLESNVSGDDPKNVEGYVLGQNTWVQLPKIKLRVFEEDLIFGREASKAAYGQYVEGVAPRHAPAQPRTKVSLCRGPHL